MSSLYAYLRIILMIFKNMTKNIGPAGDKAYFSATNPNHTMIIVLPQVAHQSGIASLNMYTARHNFGQDTTSDTSVRTVLHIRR